MRDRTREFRNDEKATTRAIREKLAGKRTRCVTTEIIGIFPRGEITHCALIVKQLSLSLSLSHCVCVCACLRLPFSLNPAKYGFLRTFAQTKQTIFCGENPPGRRAAARCKIMYVE